MLGELKPKGPKGRKHGLSTEQVPVSAYVGSSKNLKDLKEKGEVFAYVGSIQNLKDLEDHTSHSSLRRGWFPIDGSF